MSGADILKVLRTASLRPVTFCGQSFYVRGLTGEERKLLRQRAKDNAPLEAYELVGLAACDADGAPLFTSEQAAELGQVDGAAIEEMAAEILRASKLMAEDGESAAGN
jgi:hypothetical protein